MISERTLRKWRGDSLKALKIIEERNAPSTSSHVHERVLKLTQELLDQHLLRRK